MADFQLARGPLAVFSVSTVLKDRSTERRPLDLVARLRSIVDLQSEAKVLDPAIIV